MPTKKNSRVIYHDPLLLVSEEFGMVDLGMTLIVIVNILFDIIIERERNKSVIMMTSVSVRHSYTINESSVNTIGS